MLKRKRSKSVIERKETLKIYAFRLRSATGKNSRRTTDHQAGQAKYLDSPSGLVHRTTNEVFCLAENLAPFSAPNSKWFGAIKT